MESRKQKCKTIASTGIIPNLMLYFFFTMLEKNLYFVLFKKRSNMFNFVPLFYLNNV